MEQSNVKVASELGAALAEAKNAQAADGLVSAPFVVVPEGFAIKDLERLFDAPYRRSGTTVYRDAASFCAAVKLDAGEGTRIYGNPLEPSFKAVFNDHGIVPGWRDHIATYSCPKAVEWVTWHGSNKHVMTQEQFAQFIEDNAPDCVAPPAAEMIEIARTLEATKKVNFASGIRLSNGQNELTYEETISGTAGKGKFVVPELFTIGIAVLEGGDKYAINARLRYRIADGGKLTIWYALERPHKVLEDAGKDVWRGIAETTGFAILNGG